MPVCYRSAIWSHGAWPSKATCNSSCQGFLRFESFLYWIWLQLKSLKAHPSFSQKESCVHEARCTISSPRARYAHAGSMKPAGCARLIGSTSLCSFCSLALYHLTWSDSDVIVEFRLERHLVWSLAVSQAEAGAEVAGEHFLLLDGG